MKVSVLINNYNSADYVSACVQSVLAQTRLPDEIIVVDDGSTDGSVASIEQKFNHEPLVKIIAKPNNGQLSAFNAGFRKSSGDLIFFLDADDVYSEQYLAHAIDFYHGNPDCGFLYCAYEKFGRVHGVERAYSSDQDHGCSVLESLGFLYWRGGPTSTLSLRARWHRWDADEIDSHAHGGEFQDRLFQRPSVPRSGTGEHRGVHHALERRRDLC